jgi:PmbA protein
LNLDRFLDAVRGLRPGGMSVRAWSVFASEARGVSLGIKDGEAGNPHVPISVGETCGARYRLVWSDGLLSRGYAERRQLQTDPAEALEHARAAAYDDPDAAWVLGEAEPPDVEVFDAETARVADGDTGAFAPRLDAVRERIAAGGFRTWSGSFSASRGESRLVTSAGLDLSGGGTSTGWHVTVNGELGDGFSARVAESGEAFDSRLDRLMETASLLEREAPPLVGGIHHVLLHPDVVEGYALCTLLDNLGGSTVAHDEGHFRLDQFGSGSPVLREDLSLRLDPLLPLRRGSYRFTAEGVPAARFAYIERGRLISPILDLKYARRLGLDPTPIPLAMDALFLEGPEPLALDDALVEASGGALVLSVLGVHTQDSASGDFSLSAPQVLGIGPEGLTGKLKATLSGNLFDLLSSDDLRFVRFEGEHSPGLLVRCRLDPR